MPTVSAFGSVASLIFSIIGILPGAIQAGEALVQSIQALANIGALTPEEEAALVAVTRAAVKAESKATQAVPVWRPAPVPPPSIPPNP